MRRALAVLCTIATAAVLPTVVTSAQAAPAPGGADPGTGVTRPDNRATPASSRQVALRKAAVEELMSGDARLQGRGRARTILMADGTEVDYPATQHAKLLTFLVDFGSGEGNPDFPTQTAGPVHGQIPAPGPQDNSTYVPEDVSPGHYEDMFFNGMEEQDGQSFRDLYTEMSSGRFDLSGDVSDWVSVDHPSSYYSQADGTESGQDMADFIGDSATAWFEHATATMTPSEVEEYLAGFDQWDRYDADNDGNFNEGDGYIDHFQAIHAGVGEEGGGAPWTIWSHRSGAAFDPSFSTGPDCVSADPEFDCFLPGGVEIGNTGYWIFDYTTEPENGGLGVFAHEFGHDLGLPDYYDTDSPDTDNSVGFWNLMSSGSWLSNEGHPTGTTPNHVGAYDKYYLGWYGPSDEDFESVDGLAEDAVTLTLGPSYHATSVGKQGVRVELPDGQATVAGPVEDSDDGAYLYSGNTSQTDALATSPEIEVPAVSDPMLNAQVAYDTEEDFDYAYLWVYDVEAEEWSDTPIETSRSTNDDPQLANLGNGITGSSDGWVTLEANLADYAGKTIRLQWEYLTDPATLGDFGFAVDEISLGDYSTGFEEPEVDWELDHGFTAVLDDQFDISFPQSYFIENRQYAGYDDTLTTGPYSWGHNVTQEPYTVSDRFPYQDGLVVWYVNGRYGDNNTATHPGGGVTLPVDASGEALLWVDDEGDPMALVDSRIQGFDATFDVDETDALQLTRESAPGVTGSLDVPAHPSIPVFDDSDVDAYYDDSVEGAEVLSTKVAGTGTMIQVLSSDEETGEMVVKIGERFVAATSQPEIDGTPSVGETLTAVGPEWFQSAVDTDVVWLRNGDPIDGAVGLSYELTADDVGKDIRVSFTGTKDGYQDTTVDSTEVTVLRAAPEPDEPLEVLGTARVGDTLTADGASWPEDGDSTFTWWNGATQVGDKPTYQVQPDDLGDVLRLEETFSAPGFEDATTDATTSAVEAGPAPTTTSAVGILGAAKVGSTLTAQGAGWSRAGTSTFEWSINDAPVGTGPTYDVAVGDLGKVITLTESRSTPGYLTASADVTTAAVTSGAAPTTTSSVGIAGTASVGSTLTANGAGWSRAGTSTFAWTVGGSPAGTGTTYTVTTGDLGKVITLTETRTTPGFDKTSASASTAPVAPGTAPSPTTAPKITGTARVGSTLTVKKATWPRAGTSTFAWSVGGQTVGTGTTYDVRPADAGRTVTVTETFTSPGYTAGSASATTGTVAKAPVTLTVKVGPAKRNKKVRLTVRATSPDLKVPGKVRVSYDGELVDTLALKAGKATLKLPKQAKGSYELKVTYLPERGFGAASKTVDVKVK